MKTETRTDGGFPYKEHTKFPSRYKIGEAVVLDFLEAGMLNDCEIVCIRFTESKVHYDVAVKVREDCWTVLENIDSCFVVDLFSTI